MGEKKLNNEMLDMSSDEYMKTYTHINEEDMRKWINRSFE